MPETGKSEFYHYFWILPTIFSMGGGGSQLDQLWYFSYGMLV